MIVNYPYIFKYIKLIYLNNNTHYIMFFYIIMMIMFLFVSADFYSINNTTAVDILPQRLPNYPMGSPVPSNLIPGGLIQAYLEDATDFKCYLKNPLSDFGELNEEDPGLFNGKFLFTIGLPLVVGFTGVRKGNGDTCIYIPVYQKKNPEQPLSDISEKLDNVISVIEDVDRYTEYSAHKLYDISADNMFSIDHINDLVQSSNNIITTTSIYFDRILITCVLFCVLFLFLQILNMFINYDTRNRLLKVFTYINSFLDDFSCNNYLSLKNTIEMV